jgi:hypothetical protein
MIPASRGRKTRVLLRPAHLVLGGILLFLALPLLAEVSVVTDSQGKYVRTQILTSVQNGRLLSWSQVRESLDPSKALNLDGDRKGDSRPVMREQPGTRQPWLLWSVSDGHDKEIAFATWSEGRWLGPQLLDPVDNSNDDLQPSLAFDSNGNPLAAWWRDEAVPRVFLSRFVKGAWTAPVAVSDPAVPSRRPSVRAAGDQAVVSFYTPKGLVVLFQPLPVPTTVRPDGNGPLDGPVPPPGQCPDPAPTDPGQRHLPPPGDTGGSPLFKPTPD